MSGWGDLIKNLIRISFINAFPDFLTYLLLFRRMSGWVDLKNCFLYIVQLILDPGFDTENDIRKGSPTRVLAKKKCPRNLFISTPIEVLTLESYPKGSTTRVLAHIFFRISVNWSWICNLNPEMTSCGGHPLVLAKLIFSHNSFISTPTEVLTLAGHPKESPPLVLAKIFFFVSVNLSRIRNLNPKMTSGRGHPLEY